MRKYALYIAALFFGTAAFMTIFLWLRSSWSETWAGVTGLLISLNVGWAIIDRKTMATVYAESSMNFLKLMFGKTYITELHRTDHFVGLTFLIRTIVVLGVPLLLGYVLLWKQPNLNFGLGQTMASFGDAVIGDGFFPMIHVANFFIIMIAVMVLWLRPITAHDHGWGSGVVSSRERMKYTALVVGGTIAALVVGQPVMLLFFAAAALCLAGIVICTGALILYCTMRLAMMSLLATTTVGILISDAAAWWQMAGATDFAIVKVLGVATILGALAGVAYHYLSRLIVTLAAPLVGDVLN